MQLTSAEFEKYLLRVNLTYSSVSTASIQTLVLLHAAHLFSIPFENLDIHIDQPIKTDKHYIIDKLLDKHRGGYCYESNELFALALEYIGFKIHRLVARALFPETRTRGHKMLIVEIDDKYWLADVAFGGNSIYRPIKLPTNDVLLTKSKQEIDDYKLALIDDQFGNNTYILKMRLQNTWRNMYSFNLIETMPIDFIMLNQALSTYVESPFVKQRICAICNSNSRKILIDNKFKIRTVDKIIEREVNNEEYSEILEQEFGIFLSLKEKEKLFQKK
jgi:N-hydroxyarylamine O-acetyltransferase